MYQFKEDIKRKTDFKEYVQLLTLGTRTKKETQLKLYRIMAFPTFLYGSQT